MTKLVVVTEFPGKTDLVTGKLLSGETGRIFWELIDQAEIPHSEVVIVPVLKQRPGSGKIEEFCLTKKEAEAESLKLFGKPYTRGYIKPGNIFPQPRCLKYPSA